MAEFALTRGAHIAAEPARIHALVNDFRVWRKWSPWEGLDADLRREYSGTDHGVGSTYRWSGNRRAGTGEMAIIESTPSSIVVDLEFLKPFKASNLTSFALAPVGSGTDVTWTMTGHRSAIMSVAGKLFFDKAVGKDFDRGLASLKSEAERG